MPDFSVGDIYFGARQYSPSIARWLVPDPLGEKYYDVSPYAYCAGNPISFIEAPIYATHDGTVSRIVSIESGDQNAGGNRVLITSEDGTVSTYYMHLNSIEQGITIGSVITEGQRIGAMGGSGSGRTDAYTSHLHYKLRINGELVNPVEGGDLIDPQLLIAPSVDGGTLESARITEEAPILSLFEILLQYIL